MAFKHVVLLSGGMDSACLLHHQAQKYGADSVVALHFDYGQRNTMEPVLAAKQCQRLNVELVTLALPAYQQIAIKAESGTVFGAPMDPLKVLLPHKNLVFMGVALAYAEAIGADTVAIGTTADDHKVWDASKAYYATLAELTPLTIETPLLTATKAEIATRLAAFGLEIERDTTSCYIGHHCNQCGSCYAATKAREGEP